MDTMQRGRIAIMIGVPRLWQTLYAGIKKKIDASALTRGLFSLCARVNSVAFSRFIFKAVPKRRQVSSTRTVFCIQVTSATSTTTGDN